MLPCRSINFPPITDMKSHGILSIVLCVILCGPTLVHAQDMDTELSKLTEDLAAKLKENGSKKITVLDFTDLDGNSSELGKYVAEQMTVGFVMKKREFSVLDRANLKRILAEHKLTASGLINPENAKKLGMFAGVDAMIFGKIVPVGDKISVTVQIIATETAEVTGGGKAKFQQDESIRQLLLKPKPAEETPGEGEQQPRKETRKPFGDLQAKVESLKLLPGDNVYGFASMTLIITNASDSKTYGVAFNPDFYDKLNLSNSRGDEFKATDVHGIDTAFDHNDGQYQGSFTDVLPRNSIMITAKSQVRWTGRPGDYRPYRLQTVVIFGIESEGRYPDLKKYNLVLSVN